MERLNPSREKLRQRAEVHLRGVCRARLKQAKYDCAALLKNADLQQPFPRLPQLWGLTRMLHIVGLYPLLVAKRYGGKKMRNLTDLVPKYITLTLRHCSFPARLFRLCHRLFPHDHRRRASCCSHSPPGRRHPSRRSAERDVKQKFHRGRGTRRKM